MMPWSEEELKVVDARGELSEKEQLGDQNGRGNGKWDEKEGKGEVKR